jgi:hypothetical protein
MFALREWLLAQIAKRRDSNAACANPRNVLSDRARRRCKTLGNFAGFEHRRGTYVILEKVKSVENAANREVAFLESPNDVMNG